ncbi:trypsin-like serine protease, putative [Plasmodium ovale curtisi]|uniref:Trypsin-like serine protease, putative n=1 Tax=Plasmodium ovale curtisi TaxID=864141 RepID=A0A1A8WYW9_PLAOA|nr:trypsin-like serine protease, putative [Plasmodium ovale curtisi]
MYTGTMKKSNIWPVHRWVKIVWRNGLFFSSTLYIPICVNDVLKHNEDFGERMKKEKGYIHMFLLKRIPISWCEHVRSSNRSLDDVTRKKELEKGEKSPFLKLAEYQYFPFELVIHFFKIPIRFIIHSVFYFYQICYNTFYHAFHFLSKKLVHTSNEKFRHSPSIPINILSSFVTIHKSNNNTVEPFFKVDELTFLGSGFIYDRRGYILTAAHNITCADDTFVVKNGDDFYLATVAESDVCVMKIISKESFSHISLDTIREDLRLGEPKFDKEIYSTGVVNQPKQTFTTFANFNEKKEACLYPFVQISNPINKGMSGSPLLDGQGNLVGMIQKKIDNYGLALPAHILKKVALHLQRKGTYEEPFLGIVLKEREDYIKSDKTCKKELKIHDILTNSPAEIGGLRKEDSILKINQQEIKDICEVHEILNSTGNGYIDIEIIRNNKKKKIKPMEMRRYGVTEMRLHNYNSSSYIKYFTGAFYHCYKCSSIFFLVHQLRSTCIFVRLVHTASLYECSTKMWVNSKFVLLENINKNDNLEYKLFKNISFNKIKTNLKNFLVVNKKINISDVKHVSFLGKFHNYTQIENYGVNEICILGRSNVGKSTFLRKFIKYMINVNEHANIKVSKNSGCTRSINMYSFENAKKKRLFILTDMPGLGYAAGIGKKKMEHLRKNLDDYIYLRNQICLFFVLIDMSVDIQKIDVQLVDAIRRTNVPFRVICTKSDKFSANTNDRLNAIRNFYALDKIPIHISKFSNHN